MSKEFAEPTKASRVEAICLLLVLGLFYFAHSVFWQPYIAPLLNQSICDALPWTRAVVIYWTLLFLLVVAGLVRASVLTLRSEQSPFPGAWLLFRLPLYRGWHAKLHGIILGSLAITIMAGLLYGWVFLGVGYVFCIFEPCGC